MKKSLLDFFELQVPIIPCPACGISLKKTGLTSHLDFECASLVDQQNSCKIKTENCNKAESSKNFSTKLLSKSSDKKKIFPRTKMKVKTSSNPSRLSLKEQRKKQPGISKKGPESNREIEVVTLDEDSLDIVTVCPNSKTDVTKDFNDVTVPFKADHSLSSPIVQVAPDKQKPTSSGSLKMNTDSHSPPVIETASKNAIITKSMMADSLLKTGCNPSMDLSNNLPIQYDLETSVSNNFESTNVNYDNISVHNNILKVDASKEDAKTGKQIKLAVQDCLISNIFLSNKTEEVCMDLHLNSVVKDSHKSVECSNETFSVSPESNKAYEPYYIANFKHILCSVLSDDRNKILFDSEDKTFIKAFEYSTDSAQKLFVRLFQRKYKWLRLSKINYPNIASEPGPFLDELVESQLVDSGSENIELETALELLSLAEAKTLVKQFSFNSSGKSKSDITQMLVKHCKEHKSVFFTVGKNDVSSKVLKKVKQVLGPCYRISLLPKRLFTRILMLFSLPAMSEDDDDAAGGQQQQLLTLLQVNKGELTFPKYKISSENAIFANRDELIRYEEAKELENDITNAVESKNFELAKELYENARDEFEEQLLSPFVERAASLPTFLKKFTSFHIYIRCLTQGVEILQRMRLYKDAVKLLRRLLDQKVFCQDYRGRWWDRLALNLEQHLKQKSDALEAIKEAFFDKNVRVGHRYSLLTRALRILKTIDDEEFRTEVLEAIDIMEAPRVIIKGRLCPRSILGRRNVFISASSATENDDDVTVLGVEQLAIEHYQNEGFTEGLHGEGSTFHSVYGLLFWDIIYDGDIPDAFISPYQNHPLDLNHESFFIRREKQILNHLEKLKNSTIEEIKEIAKSSWQAHFGESSLVFWDRFTDVDHILGLISCMGNKLLCGICERLARDFRFTRSGVPDLVVWNPDTQKIKIVEVKGPGDKLSSKQILWLDYLLKLGADAEVCHVEAIASKKLRRE